MYYIAYETLWQSRWERVLKENGYMYMFAESLHCPPEMITMLLMSYTTIQNKNIFIFLRYYIFIRKE